MKGRTIASVLGILFSAWLFTACGGGGGSSSAGPSPPSATVQGVAVDPYIIGATFFEDANGNGIHDAGERLSTVTDALGQFTFEGPLAAGGAVIMKDKGSHNGLPFSGTLKRLVDAGHSGLLVISPLTTLMANKVSPRDLCLLLEEAGLPGVLEEELFRNPMEAIELLEPSEIDDAKLKLLRAAVAVNSFLAVMGYDASYADCTTDRAKALLRNLVTVAKGALSAPCVKGLSDKLEQILAPLDPQRLWPVVTVFEACKTAALVVDTYVNRIKTYLKDLPSLHPDDVFSLLPAVDRILEECSLADLADLNRLFYVDVNIGIPEIDDAVAGGILHGSRQCTFKLDVNADDPAVCAVTVTVDCGTDPGGPPSDPGGQPSDPPPTPDPGTPAESAWIHTYAPPFDKILDNPRALAVDASGSVFVVGTSKGDGTGNDILTLKYSSAGDLLWAKRYNGSANSHDEAEALALDAAGNVHVAGTVETASEFADIVLIKYDTDGNELWVRQYDGPAGYEDDVNAMAVDAAGNVYLVGTSMNSMWYGSNDYATVKYDKDGNKIWAVGYDGPKSGIDTGSAVAVDGSGNVYITGASEGVGTALDFATLKYNSAGELQWVKRYHNSGDEVAVALALDKDGNIAVAGSGDRSGSSVDYLVVKYDNSGNELWAAYLDSPGHAQDNLAALAVDSSGGIFVTGTAGNELWAANSGYLTAGFSAGGALQWSARYDGPGNGWDRASALAIDAAGNIVVTGQSKGADTASDFATVAYSPATGAVQWIERYSGSGAFDDSAQAVCADSSGNVYVTGYTATAADQTQITTIKYVP
jgi:uncharacterized delta-60 repeat protein